MYLRDYDRDNDTCPHSTFSGCDCYDDPAAGADEYEYDRAAKQRDPEYKPSDDPNVWVTGTGASIQIADMTDEHLANALGKQVHYHGVQHPRTRTMLAELTRRTHVPESAPLTMSCDIAGDKGVS